MKKLTAIFLVLIAVLSAVLTACGGDGAPKYTAVTANADGKISIPTDGITSNARFFNYDVKGITVQLLALRDGNGGIRVAFNTCQNCSPSPKAYYVQENGKLICQNCKFEFTAEEVGIAHGGCNPWPIDGIEITDSEVIIPVSSVEAISARFASWGGPTK